MQADQPSGGLRKSVFIEMSLTYRPDSCLERTGEGKERLVALPINLNNKHWDNLIVRVRDFHLGDTLQFGSYEGFRKLVYRQLGLTFKHEPIMCLEVVRKVEVLDDKQKADMKEMQVTMHKQTEQKVDKIYR